MQTLETTTKKGSDNLKMPKIPEECPHTKTCSVPVDRDHAEHLCLTSNWIHCDLITNRELRPYKLKPSEWKQLLGEEKMKSAET